MSKPSSDSSKLRKKLNKVARRIFNRHRKYIADMILYGSAVKGKSLPRDVDIAVIFKKVGKESYDIVYDFRKELERLGFNADIKGIGTEELLDPKLFIRPSLFIEGISLIKRRKLSEALGFLSYSIFSFSLKSMNKSKKTMFQYALKGRGKSRGILEEYNGRHLGKGVVLVPIENSEKFVDFLKFWKIEYEEIRGLFIKTQ